MKYKFIATAKLWRDKVNGNTYHSVRIVNTATGKEVVCGLQYGYGDHYRQTALNAMQEEGWIPKTTEPYLFERENDYPIYWHAENTTKREAKAWGEQ